MSGHKAPLPVRPAEEAADRARALAVNLGHLLTARSQPSPQVFSYLSRLAQACALWCSVEREGSEGKAD